MQIRKFQTNIFWEKTAVKDRGTYMYLYYNRLSLLYHIFDRVGSSGHHKNVRLEGKKVRRDLFNIRNLTPSFKRFDNARIIWQNIEGSFKKDFNETILKIVEMRVQIVNEVKPVRGSRTRQDVSNLIVWLGWWSRRSRSRIAGRKALWWATSCSRCSDESRQHIWGRRACLNYLE